MIIKNNKRLDIGTDTLPIGSIMAFAGATIPNGYLLCNGDAVSKTVYADLYAVCGDKFGTGTSTTFKLPDLRGKTIAGYKQGSTFSVLGLDVGAETHNHTTGDATLTVAQMPSHNHSAKLFGGSLSVPGNSGILPWANELTSEPGGLGTIATYQEYNGSILFTGSSQPHNHGTTGSSSNIQPTLTLNWIIKAYNVKPVAATVENVLTSTSPSNALSAYQGKVLNDRVAALEATIATLEPIVNKLNINLGDLAVEVVDEW